jgi:hypothetical protein
MNEKWVDSRKVVNSFVVEVKELPTDSEW